MDGSTIGIDQSTQNVIDGEIYAVDHDGMLRVKFLYRLPGVGLRLRSYNREEYPDEEYSPAEIEAQNMKIIGWVFWWSTVRFRRAPTLVR
ncbi:HTH-type transcriptional regulator PrtR [compost metagenome]